MATGRRRFAVLNRAINPLVRWLMRSPLHWLASRRVALISYTGRRSGRRFTIPVGYEMAGLQLTITVGSPERKVWWRSLTGPGAPVELVIRGRSEPVTLSRPEPETRRSFASRWVDDGRRRAAVSVASHGTARERG